MGMGGKWSGSTLGALPPKQAPPCAGAGGRGTQGAASCLRSSLTSGLGLTPTQDLRAEQADLWPLTRSIWE